MNRCITGLFITALLLAPALLNAKSDKDAAKAAPPEAYAKVAACKQIATDAERLACYDAAIAAFDTALSNNDVYMVDKKQVRETKRSLFGLPLPSFGLFGDGKDDDKANDAVDELVSTITHVTSNGNGWVITIKEGSTWQQMDSAPLALSPKVGGAVTIKKAALGSYKMNVGKQPAIRVKRII